MSSGAENNSSGEPVEKKLDLGTFYERFYSYVDAIKNKTSTTEAYSYAQPDVYTGFSTYEYGADIVLKLENSELQQLKFSEICVGKTEVEISRYFTTAVTLVSNYIIDIQSSDPLDESSLSFDLSSPTCSHVIKLLPRMYDHDEISTQMKTNTRGSPCEFLSND